MRAGNIKAFAVTAKTRLASAPEIPTVDEAGLPGFYISLWNAIWAPKGTPKEIIAKLNAAVGDALADPRVRQQLADLGQEIPPRDQQTPQALGAYQKAEIEKWWPIIKAAHITAGLTQTGGSMRDTRMITAIATLTARERAGRRAGLAGAAGHHGGSVRGRQRQRYPGPDHRAAPGRAIWARP